VPPYDAIKDVGVVPNITLHYATLHESRLVTLIYNKCKKLTSLKKSIIAMIDDGDRCVHVDKVAVFSVHKRSIIDLL